MIVSPDFFEHWKTKALIELSHRAESPLWVMRLWAHCQTRQEFRFNLPAIALKAICSVPSEISAEQWFEWLLRCKFIEGTPKKWTVHGWAEANASLVSRWFNGRQAKTKRKVSGAEAEPKRTASGAEAEPKRKDVSLEDKRREEKRREDREEAEQKTAARPLDLAETKTFFVAQAATELEAEAFFDFYEASGWKMNTGRPLASWHAAARRWIRTNRTRTVAASSGPKNFGSGGASVASPELNKLLNDPTWAGGAYPAPATD
jgi:hypothetical protein